MRLMILPLVMTCVGIASGTLALAQVIAPLPDWAGSRAPATLDWHAGVDADGCDGAGCGADCGCASCRNNCPIFTKLIADTCWALEVLVAGSHCGCSSCGAAACWSGCGSDCSCDCDEESDSRMQGDPAAEGGFEIVPRESWPEEYKEVPPPPERTTRSVMRLQRDAYARQTRRIPTLAVAAARRAPVERAAAARGATAASDAGRPEGGFTACVTDMAD